MIASRQPTGEGGELPSRQFVFRLAAADIIAYEVRVQTLDRRTKLLLVVFVGVAGLILTALPDSLPAWIWGSLAGVAVIASLAAAIIYPNLQARRRAAAWKLPSGETTVIIGPDGVTETADGHGRRIPYRAIAGVAEGAGHLFLTTAQGPVILPAHVFRDAADYAAVSDAVREAAFRARKAVGGGA